MCMLWPNQKKNVECTPTPLLIIINDSFSEIYFYGTIILKNISNILNLFISQSGQQRGTLHFSQNLTSVEVLSLRLCRYLYFRRNCRILIRQQQSQGVVPPYFLPCMEKRARMDGFHMTGCSLSLSLDLLKNRHIRLV